MKVATNQERLIELFDSDPRSDTAIANELHVSKQALSSWRKGRRSPKKSVLERIAEMYNVSFEWLMGFDVGKEWKLNLQMFASNESEGDNYNEQITDNPDIRLLINGLSKMPPEQIRKAKDVMKAVFAEYASYFEEDNHDDA